MSSDSWPIVKIGDVCELATGGTPPKSRPECFGGSIRWLVSGDIHQSEINDCDGRITDEGLASCNAKPLPVGSVMIALNGQGKTRATVAMLRCEATCNQSLVSIYPKDTSQLLPEFIFMNLHGRYEELRKMTGDSGNERRGLNMRIIRTIEIPLPPLSEQRRIVSVLDAAFAGLATATANTQKNLQNAREIFSSYLNNLFSSSNGEWEKRNLGDVTGFQNGFAFKSKLFGTTGMPVLRISNIQEDAVVESKLVYTDPNDYEEDLSRYEVEPGDLLIAMSGATTGKVGFNNTGNHFLLNQRVGKFEPTRELNTQFLFLFLKTKVADNLEVAVGAAQPNLSTKQIKSLQIPLPSRKEQDAVVNRAEELREQSDAIRVMAKRKLDALEELKQSILHRAFRGELSGDGSAIDTNLLETAGA